MKLLVDPDSFAEDGSPRDFRVRVATTISVMMCLGYCCDDVVQMLRKHGALKTVGACLLYKFLIGDQL